MQVQAYLFFEGRCEEAIEFYGKALGAKVEMLMRYKDAPPGSGPSPAGNENKVMHASMRIGETRVMASDGHCSQPTQFKGFGLTLNVRDPAEAQRLFDALKEGGNVAMPLAKTFFSPSFGMVTDRFGVLWMVIVEA